MASLTNEEQALFELACTGRLDEQSHARLQTFLLESPPGRQRYLAYCEMHSDLCGAVRLARLRQRLVEAIREDEAPLVAPVRETSRPAKVLGAALAIAASLLIAVQIGFREPAAEQGVQLAEAGDASLRWPQAVATVNRVEDVVWHVTHKSYEPQDHLSRDEVLRIESGLLEIEFRQGAVVVLEGPAHFVPRDSNGATLLAGKLAAVAPPWATGFRIDTPGIDVIDHGTEFAVSVSSDAGQPKVNVSVTEGEVEVLSDKKKKDGRRLTAGEGVKSVGLRLVEGNDDETRRLTEYLPDRPGLKGGVVVGDRWEDWTPGRSNEPRSAGAWRYYTNLDHKYGDPAGYVQLIWDPESKSYRPPLGVRDQQKYSFVRVHRDGGHPGQGVTQVDDGVERYSIAGFVVPEDGAYRIESGWLERYEANRWDLDDVLDIRFHVNSEPMSLEAVCDRSGFVAFRGSLGRLKAGDVIYGGVGPRGVAHGDRFRWGYYIVLESESTPLVAAANQSEP